MRHVSRPAPVHFRGLPTVGIRGYVHPVILGSRRGNALGVRSSSCLANVMPGAMQDAMQDAMSGNNVETDLKAAVPIMYALLQAAEPRQTVVRERAPADLPERLPERLPARLPESRSPTLSENRNGLSYFRKRAPVVRANEILQSPKLWPDPGRSGRTGTAHCPRRTGTTTLGHAVNAINVSNVVNDHRDLAIGTIESGTIGPQEPW